MKPLFDRVFSKAKTLFDAYKMWVFFAAIIGSNGIQAGFHLNKADEVHVKKEQIEKHVAKPVNKTTIIYKSDNEFCKELVKSEFKKHLNSPNH